jgi:hypothetical protein
MMQWTVMNRLLCGQSSDSDGRSLHIAGLGQPAGRRHSTAPNGVRRGAPAGRAGRGWTGSKVETRGGPGRAGRRSKMYSWKLVTDSRSVPTDNSNGTIQQRFVTLLEKDRAESSAQFIPVQATMNTLDTSACSCRGKPGIRSGPTKWKGFNPEIESLKLAPRIGWESFADRACQCFRPVSRGCTRRAQE